MFWTTCSDFKGLQIIKFPIYYQNLPKSWSNFLLLQKPMTKLVVLDQLKYCFQWQAYCFPKFCTEWNT
jgi:hypothetical protein